MLCVDRFHLLTGFAKGDNLWTKWSYLCGLSIDSGIDHESPLGAFEVVLEQNVVNLTSMIERIKLDLLEVAKLLRKVPIEPVNSVWRTLDIVEALEGTFVLSDGVDSLLHSWFLGADSSYRKEEDNARETRHGLIME